MNDLEIENLLRKAPRLRAPEGLLKQLKADIPAPRVNANRTPHSEPVWRRWFPALSFGVLLLGCFIVLAVQTSQFLELRRENESLRAATANLDQLQEDNARLQRLRGVAPEATRLQNEDEQLVKLRAEVAQLRVQTLELAALRAENQRLQAERVAAAVNAGVAHEEDPFMTAQEQARRDACVNNLKQIGFAARKWANDHQDVLPTDFLIMSNELSTPTILICPSDTVNKPAANWQEFDAGNVSYAMLSPGANLTTPQVVYSRCSIHHKVGLADGSVQQLGKSFTVKQVDGKFVMVSLQTIIEGKQP